ncbi:unnamed protein product [Effrenium voratum]|uniref:Uncharacterized protein n=1 Tax=Effrenium voratum TaxID=2562239 RepID=A0AA36I2T7_9DINO|nr:unnamed protein product [Effrenium voratum]
MIAPQTTSPTTATRATPIGTSAGVMVLWSPGHGLPRNMERQLPPSHQCAHHARSWPCAWPNCEAGFSKWMQGWSDSKKDWCCDKANKGCVKFHCTGEAQAWHGAKQEWCCQNFQKGCPHTTLSPLKCDATCTFNGETSKCMDRIQWAVKNAFSRKADACNLAYSKIQVECGVCRACSIQEAGCGVHGAASDPFDCLAALNNFFRAWSPEKKHWCCTKQGRGCEGSSPPAVDAGTGMMWKHV